MTRFLSPLSALETVIQVFWYRVVLKSPKPGGRRSLVTRFWHQNGAVKSLRINPEAVRWLATKMMVRALAYSTLQPEYRRNFAT
jgi:hypothetical protein